MNIKANEVCKIANNAFGTRAYSRLEVTFQLLLGTFVTLFSGY
jgi:hypothetical protein